MRSPTDPIRLKYAALIATWLVTALVLVMAVQWAMAPVDVAVTTAAQQEIDDAVTPPPAASSAGAIATALFDDRLWPLPKEDVEEAPAERPAAPPRVAVALLGISTRGDDVYHANLYDEAGDAIVIAEAGGSVGRYTVLEIGRTHVRLRDRAGREHELKLDLGEAGS